MMLQDIINKRLEE
jgi:hypothetical protein